MIILTVTLTAAVQALPVCFLKSQRALRKIMEILAGVTVAVNAENKTMSSGPRCRNGAIIIRVQTVLDSHLSVRHVAATDVPSVTTDRHRVERAGR